MDFQKMVIGTWGIGGPNTIGSIELGWPKIASSEALTLLEFCYDQGVRKYDTSDMYGRGKSERLLGKLVKSGANDVKVITKGGVIPQIQRGTSKLVKNFNPTYLKSAIHLSLERLQLETLYGYLLHGIKSTEFVASLSLLATDLKDSNLVKKFGVSVSRSESSLSNLAEQSAIDLLEVPYSLAKPNYIKLIDSIKSPQVNFLFRSILFHGILVHEGDYSFQESDHRKAKINKGLLKKIDIFHKHLKKKDISPLEATIIVALGSPHEGDIVYGAKSIEQTKQFLRVYKNCLNNYSENIRNEILSEAERTFIYQ